MLDRSEVRLERGVGNVGVLNLARIAKALRVSLSTLFEGD